MRWRPLLWWVSFILLALAALACYSANPRVRRHVTPLALGGAALFSLGWAVGPSEALD